MIYDHWSHLLNDFDQPWINPSVFSTAISWKEIDAGGLLTELSDKFVNLVNFRRTYTLDTSASTDSNLVNRQLWINFGVFSAAISWKGTVKQICKPGWFQEDYTLDTNASADSNFSQSSHQMDWLQIFLDLYRATDMMQLCWGKTLHWSV